MPVLSGLFAPMVTPFTDDGGSISEIRLAKVVRHLRQNGAQGFVICSETGEFTTINTGERKQLLELVLRQALGLPVITHCTRLGTAQALDLCQHASRHGARAAVIMPPYFGTYGEDEIEQHIRMIVQHAGLPIILVDPLHTVRADMRERMSNMADLYFAQTLEGSLHSRLAVDPTGASSDEFVFDDAVVSPLIQIDPKAVHDPNADLRPLANFVAMYGRARVAKAALNERDIEVGPPRAPVLTLRHEPTQELLGMVQTD
ncbi:MAG TPA: dihydrodipicolinate synthase family protein [Fimbriimonadaceae bacterium]|nr:dihydrodipicolinate synthase family protein [Fimbriimonadaceae bacterium]